MEDIIYDHYIAIDWAAANMAIARMTKKTNKISVIDVPSDIKELQFYLKNLKGKKIVAIEETTTSQWLYTELYSYADKVFVCDPHRNRLLTEGPKTDKIDASKLVQLLKAQLLKEVYHSNDKFLHLRRLVSGYEDVIKAAVRLKAQRYALLRACGKSGYEKSIILDNKSAQFVLKGLERQISSNKQERHNYEKEFKRLSRQHPEIRHQKSLPGIGDIGAVKIIAKVVTPWRFGNKGHFLSYAGLIKLDKISGGRSYRKKNSRYCRQLKSVYKMGTISAIGGNNPINDYYEHLIRDKNYPPYHARHKACRRLATLSLGVLKSGKKYEPHRRDKKIRQ